MSTSAETYPNVIGTMQSTRRTVDVQATYTDPGVVHLLVHAGDNIATQVAVDVTLTPAMARALAHRLMRDADAADRIAADHA